MEIYGLGIVAGCMFVGSFIRRLLGSIMGVNGDVGGVGFAMLIFILVTQYLDSKGKPLSEGTQRGIYLLSALYIPVVVAMSANQNVVVALESGFVPFVAGIVATFVGLLLVPVISLLSKETKEEK